MRSSILFMGGNHYRMLWGQEGREVQEEGVYEVRI
jgi:hypothetical protein